MPFWRTDAGLTAGWARGRLHDAAAGAEDLRRVLADRRPIKGRGTTPGSIPGCSRELEAETLGAESALARIDEAMALARQVENRCNLAFPHLLRGELLLKRDPSNPAPAEEAFQTAIAIAKQQGARSCGSARGACRSPSSTNRPAAPPTRTPSSRPRSKAFRRRPKCRRSLRRRRCWWLSRPARM